MKKIIIFLALLLGVNHAAKAQTFSVNTDLTMLALQTYNMGAEMTMGNRSTLGLSVFVNNKPYFHKEMKVVGVQPEYRYYFGGRPMYHHFVGLSLLAASYDMTWNNRNYDGTAWGAGLSFGYVIPLTDRLSIDAHAGVGVVFSHHKETMLDGSALVVNGDAPAAEGFWSHRILPTKIGVTLSYAIW
ncbi:MAG: DUF3575 domain-containing protein [Hoylesella marshii]|uniref:DUF3575 domain-containing protein n=1 Tax=Hoylesella marshii DSM 16973 = JCM 13450 TaxID=862515 RepID=E0NTA8_9BACT|nr:DUF3575 domain-containing protein [Hoylesella marshii]EFM01575.1 hypothetical protein HMPREF0658_1410 [Hoylesella marshii DSM 16973 = JCM 13450]